MHPLERGDPRAVGSHRILARIGTGGTAVVYLGRSRGGRVVAVKVLHAELAREPEHRDRFRREAAATRAAGGVHSPPFLDADPDADVPWMATAFLPSISLRDAVERFGPLPPASVRRLAAWLAEALAALHRAGIVHLDVKPANVLLTADGPRLIDFGIAAGTLPAGSAGSWGFMSPEQVAGHAGPPSDIYSLGATLEYAHGGQGCGDETLSALIAACREPDATARPTAAELTACLVPAARDAEPPGAAWLPPPVMAAIDLEASASDNPPTPPPPLPTPRRRLLLTGGAAVLAAATGVTAVLAATSDGGQPAEDERPPESESAPSRATAGAAPAASASAPSPSAPTPSPSPTAEPAVLRLVVTGDGGPLTSLDYAVNGEFTRLKNVALPWRTTVEVPRERGGVDWRVRLTIASGKVRIRVYLDGSRLRDERYPSATMPFFSYPSDVDTGGATTFPGPLPGAGG
ncbi:hypothetical protein GCM10027168_15880 [Streptomyces capparidis]